MNINEDIIELIWEHTKFPEYKKTALISRDFSKNLKNISKENQLKIIYESKTTTEFIIYYSVKIAKEFNYIFNKKKIDYMRENLNKFYKFDSYKSIGLIEILCEYVEIALHSLNKNHNMLLKKLNGLKDKFNETQVTNESYRKIATFLITQNLSTNKHAFDTRRYSIKTNTLLRTAIILLLFEINRMIYNRNIDEEKKIYKIINMQSDKSTEYISILEKEDDYPKYLNNKIIKMFQEHVNI